MKIKKDHSEACLEANQGVGKNEGFTCTDNCLDKPQHTPMPWKLTKTGDGSLPITAKVNGVDARIAEVFPQDFAQLKANAAFIVRAVNAYEKDQEMIRELLAALKSSQKLIQMARQYFPKSIHNSDHFTLEITCAEIGRAIAKAEGK